MKVRIYQLARDLRISSDALVNMLHEMGHVDDVKSHMSSIDGTLVDQIRGRIAQTREAVRKEDEDKAKREEVAKAKAKEDQEARRRAAAARAAVPPPVKAAAKTPTTARSPAKAPTPPRTQPQHGQRFHPAATTRPGHPSGPPRTGGKKRRKGRHQTDERLVREAVRKTIATMDSKRRRVRRRRSADSGASTAEVSAPIKVTEFMTVGELASVIDANPNEVIGACLQLGIPANINRRLETDLMNLIATEFDCELEFVSEYGEETLKEAVEDEGDFESKPRSPVVTVMGHVDHGKTSLLDYIRKARVVAGEAGGITQHIGAYGVSVAAGRVTFLDTPGHEAFTAMRARGAQVTDIVVLVVAADSQVMPQTIEAINHARAAEVPIVVAITKIDIDAANPEKIRAQLAEHQVVVEQYGGKTVCVDISSKTGEGIDKLLEMILLQAEILELTAEPERPARGVIIESKRDPGKGVVATVLVRNGTVHGGDPFVCGIQHGKVRVMVNDTGGRVKEAGPATPVEVWGWSGMSQAGDTFNVCRSEQEARDIARKRTQIHREHELRLSRRRTLIDISQRIRQGEILGLNLVLKGDVAGSVEVLQDSFEKLSTDEVQVRVIHQGVGAINESDVLLAAASEAIVVGFHVKPDPKAQLAAQAEKVDVRLHKVIYEAVDEVRSAMSGLLEPDKVEKINGTAEVRQVFRIHKMGNVAGCMVSTGTIRRSDFARLRREGEEVWKGKIGTLKRFKEDAKEVATGFECGIGLDGYDDVREGDLIESFIIEEVARKIE